MSGRELAESLDPPEQEAVEQPVEAEKPETEEVVEGEPKEAEKPAKTVPLAALHEERERRKELQKELQRIQNENAARHQMLEQRMSQIQQAAYAQHQPRPPEYETDPVGNIKYGVEQTQAELARLAQFQAQQYQEAQQREYVGQIHGAVNSAEQRFTQEHPDYLEAVGWLKLTRAKQLQALGYDDGQVAAWVTNEAMQIAETALRGGRNPAEVAYQMAQASGWSAKPKAKPEAQEKMETLQKGVKAAQSLGSGGTPKGQLTVDAIAQMDDDEFDAFMKSGGWNKLG